MSKNVRLLGIDGLDHALWALGGALATKFLLPAYVTLYVFCAILVLILIEARQEYIMYRQSRRIRDNNWYKPWNWNSSRHKDWGLGTASLLLFLLGYL